MGLIAVRGAVYWLLFFAFPTIGLGVDTGRDAHNLVRMRDAESMVGVPGGWVRLRGIAEEIERNASGPTVAEMQSALTRLHVQGLKGCVLLRWGPKSWGGTHGGAYDATRPRGQLPRDLRMAYERCHQLGVTYGELVDAWEIDNEPDLGFVPENAEHYAAFLKAAYLGFKAGATTLGRSAPSRNLSLETSSLPRAPLVVMAPMGLPPGPWFERFVANHGLAYTDGFNFHFYGYAEDFTGVYRAFEEAVTDAARIDRHGASRATRDGKAVERAENDGEHLAGGIRPSALRAQRRELPIFATEIGYGMLGMRERDTKAARLRQWRWFKSVGEQVARLRLEAPMAFYLRRYHEATGLEFGLTVPHTSPKHFDLYARSGWRAGDNSYGPHDFDVETSAEWMKGIGRRIAGGDATPALAWWLAQDKSIQPKHDWALAAAEPSPVVIDLIARENVYGEHRYNGYFVRGTKSEASGSVDLVLYNFSERAVKGSLRLPLLLHMEAADIIELAPMERRMIPAVVTVSSRQFAAQEARIEFVSDDAPTARFVTQFYPQFEGRNVAREWRLTEARVAQSPFAAFEATRELATEEAPKHRDSSCWVQHGARVQWSADGFSVTITDRPPHKERRVEVEIPWPADWGFAPGRLLKLEYRATQLAPRSKEWPAHDEFMVQLRTANGNLYAGAPMRNVRETWSAFWEPSQNFTLWFYGRANLPWEFGKNRPVSLLLAFYPVALPVTYEFRGPALVELAPLAASQSGANR